MIFQDDIPPTFENCTNVNRLVHPYMNHKSSDKKSKVIFNINTSTGLTKVSTFNNFVVFGRKVVLVPKVTLRYGRLKFFFFGPEKRPHGRLVGGHT